MATTTENLGLTLPAGTDKAEISVLNENFQALDTFAGQATADIQEARETADAAAPQSTTYTKSEVDTALAEKVDKETGKGLSTNDFTDTDKENLTTAIETAEAAAPQSTTYTKAEVDTALAAKASLEDILGLGTAIESNADMDSLNDIGKWYCSNATIAETVTNAPFTDAGYFGWTIRSIASSDRYVQIAVKNSDDFVIAKRRYSGTWSAWSFLTGTAAT